MAQERHRQSRPSSRARILVAEDDPEMRRLLLSLLRTEGYEVDAVADGEHLAVTLFCQARSFDLVVADVRLPRRTSLDVLEALRDRGYDIPVVLMTGFGDEETRRRAGQVQAVYVDKPFDVGELHDAIERLLDTSCKREGSQDPPESGVSRR